MLFVHDACLDSLPHVGLTSCLLGWLHWLYPHVRQRICLACWLPCWLPGSPIDARVLPVCDVWLGCECLVCLGCDQCLCLGDHGVCLGHRECLASWCCLW